MKKVTTFLFVLIGFSLLLLPYPARAEEVGDTITATITFTASENVTAADFTVSATNGTIISVSCGGSGFNDFGSSGNNCILAHLGGGAASGTLATVEVEATAAGTLTVSATGDLSNSGGDDAADGQLLGESFTITASTTPTPTVPANATATPLVDTLPNTAGGGWGTLLILVGGAFILGYGLVKADKTNKTHV